MTRRRQRDDYAIPGHQWSESAWECSDESVTSRNAFHGAFGFDVRANTEQVKEAFGQNSTPSWGKLNAFNSQM